MAITESIGWFGVLLAASMWGVWAAPFKSKRVASSGIDTMVLQMYVSCAVLLVAFLLLLFIDFRWTRWAILGACIWVPTNAAVVLAIRVLGLGITSGLVSGNIIISSFVWGATATSVWGEPACHMGNPGAAVFGLFVLIAAIAGLAYFGSPRSASSDNLAFQDLDKMGSEPEGAVVDTDSVISGSPTGGSATGAVPDAVLASPDGASAPVAVAQATGTVHKLAAVMGGELATPVKPAASTTKGGGSKALAYIGTILIGWIAGSIVVPMQLAKRDGISGLGFVPPFSVCVFVLTVVMLAGAAAIQRRKPVWHAEATLAPALCAGILWSIGNIGSVLASLSPLGQTTGFPLTQSAVLIAGLIAIFVYKEVRGKRRIASFMASGGVLIMGATLLANFGKCQ